MEVASILKMSKRISSGTRESCGPRWVTVGGMTRRDINADVGVNGRVFILMVMH
jgi:hypothetical protein